MDAEFIDRSMASRLQRHLDRAIREFLEAETGLEPHRSMSTYNQDFHDYEQSWRYAGLSLGVQIRVQVVD